ncbi:MAG: phage protein NinX family protein [Trinickia sp.]|uniref:phage protein NinX family protein n=1 Tax=Trinickia sp. TaxID=2571163 RepID=UPI003F809A51
MKTSELEGCALDYWCARALVDDDEEIAFIQVEPSIVVTFTHGTLRKLAQPFSPSSEWGEALEIVERAQELRWIRGEQDTHCWVRFDGSAPHEGHAAHPRIALLRAFVQVRFGETVEPYPRAPHAVLAGKVHAYDAGGVPPSYGDNAGADSEIGNIRSVPRP